MNEELNLTKKTSVDIRLNDIPVQSRDCFIYNDDMYFLSFTSSLYKYDGTSWIKISTCPIRNIGDIIVYENEIHVLGSSSNTNAHYTYDGTSWTDVGSLPYPFYGGISVVLNDELHLLGGSSSKNTSYSHNHYMYKDNTWTNVGNLIYGTYSLSPFLSIVYNGEIYIMGYATNYNTFYKWNGIELDYGFGISFEITETSKTTLFVYNNELHIMGADNTKNVHKKYNGSDVIDDVYYPFIFSHNNCIVVYDNEIHAVGVGHSYTGGIDTLHYIFQTNIYK